MAAPVWSSLLPGVGGGIGLDGQGNVYVAGSSATNAYGVPTLLAPTIYSNAAVNRLPFAMPTGLSITNVLQLIAIGLCVGLALGIFFVGLLGRGSS